jgi:oligopeptide transport system substrate-binding protein
MTKAKVCALLGAALTFAVLAGCGGSDPAAGLKVYRHSENGSPTNVDPIQSATGYANIVVVNAYDTLYRYKYLARPYELVPNLAADLPEISEDGLTYTIRLKQGVEFIDDPAFADGKGREVVAEDVIYSLKRHFDPNNVSQGAWLWEGKIVGLDEWRAAGGVYDAPIEGMTALDSHTLEFRLTRPFPQFPFTLAQGFSAVVPREAVERYGAELARRPVGSGPFKLISFDSTRVVFERNPKFRQEPLDLDYEGYDPELHGHLGIDKLAGLAPPYVDRLEIDWIDEPPARWASFTSGREIKYTAVPPEQLPSVLESTDPVTLRPEYAARYHMRSGPESSLVYYLFNMDDPAIGRNDDPERDRMNHALRCAIRDAFSWDERNARFYGGIGIVFPGVIPPVVPEFDPELDRDSVTRNVERARRRLAEAGWTADQLPVFEYASTSGSVYREMFEQFRGNLTEIGYPAAKIQHRTFANFGDYNRAMRTKQLMIMGSAWSLDYPDAENVLQLFYGPNEAPGSNISNYKNPEYDKLYEQSAVMQPGPERTALFHQMNQMVIDDCVAIGSLTRQTVFLYHRDVIGLPDREVLGGFWLRFVDIAPESDDVS